MPCLKDYIGLRSVTVGAPESGKFINTLPGMPTELADSISVSPEEDTESIWSDVQDRAIMRIESDTVAYLAGKAKLNQVVYSTSRFHKYSNNSENVEATDEYRGVYVIIPESKYVKFRLNSVYVYNNGGSITTTLKIFDVNDGVELHSEAVNLANGLNEIEVNEEFTLRFGVLELFIGVDCSSVDTIKTREEFYNWHDEDYACITCSSYNNEFNISPATLPNTEDAIEANLTKSIVGKGIAINADIICSVEEFICRHKQNFISPYLYLLGVEMMNQKLGSPNLNLWTASNVANTEALMLDWESKYQRYLKNTLDGITLSGESFCFNCDESANIQTKGIMP